jgi:hypothetical protein
VTDKASPKAEKTYTSKQMGDACEMLVAAELTLAGIPALKVPDNWPHYDVIAQPINMEPQRISVKSRTYKIGAAYLSYSARDKFDWLAIVVLNCPSDPLPERRIYVVPRDLADSVAYKNAPHTKHPDNRFFKIAKIEGLFSAYRNNFSLQVL